MIVVCLCMLYFIEGRMLHLDSSWANLAFTLLILSAIDGSESLAGSVMLKSKRKV
jgi:hypothetical protein